MLYGSVTSQYRVMDPGYRPSGPSVRAGMEYSHSTEFMRQAAHKKLSQEYFGHDVESNLVFQVRYCLPLYSEESLLKKD